MSAVPLPGIPDPDRVSPVALALWSTDQASQALGMELLEVRPGYARLQMRVRADFLNGLGSCHGGYMFLLADSAFAFACNSHNQRAVAAGAQIDFVAPPHEGDVLTAEGIEQHLAGRTGFYDVTVTDQTGRRVALFRGRSASVKGEHLPGLKT
jgi:acyl-CoA thioesterase